MRDRAAYYLENKEHIKEYYQANREEKIAYAKEYYRLNKANIQAYRSERIPKLGRKKEKPLRVIRPPRVVPAPREPRDPKEPKAQKPPAPSKFEEASYIISFE